MHGPMNIKFKTPQEHILVIFFQVWNLVVLAVKKIWTWMMHWNRYEREQEWRWKWSSNADG